MHCCVTPMDCRSLSAQSACVRCGGAQRRAVDISVQQFFLLLRVRRDSQPPAPPCWPTQLGNRRRRDVAIRLVVTAHFAGCCERVVFAVDVASVLLVSLRSQRASRRAACPAARSRRSETASRRQPGRATGPSVRVRQNKCHAGARHDAKHVEHARTRGINQATTPVLSKATSALPEQSACDPLNVPSPRE